MPEQPPDDHEAETVIASDWAVRPESQVVVEQTEVQPPPRRRGPLVWPWLLALLVLVVAGLGAAYLLTRDDDEPSATTEAATTAPTTTAAEPRTVPDVVGTTSAQATETLRDAGFEANVVAVPSDRPPGTVVAQNPPGGSEHPEGATVRLNVAEAATTTSAGTTTAPTTTAPEPQPAIVPDVVGQALADAAPAFDEEGLEVAVVYVPSREAAGRVVAQAQPAGTERRRGETVQLNVSEGADPPPDRRVPDVVRLDAGAARDRLEQAGFEVLALRLDGPSDESVASQTPSGGAAIPRGSLVVLYFPD